MKNKTAAILATALLAIGSLVLVPNGNDVELSGSQNYGTLRYTQSGTADDPIVVRGNGATAQCLQITGQYIVVQNLNVTGCSTHGVFISGKHIVFEGSRVFHNVTENGTTKCSGSGGWGSAVKVYVGAEDVVIRDNDVYENCGEGIGVTRGVNVSVENNRVRDNFSVNIYLDNSPNSRAINNRVSCGNPNYFRNWPPAGPARGFLVGLEYYAGWGNQMHDVLIDSNTVENCGAIRLYKDSEMSGQSVSNVTISNNTFIGVPSPFVSVAGATISNNTSGGAATLTATPPTLVTVTPTRTPTATRTITPTLLPITGTATPTASPVALWQCTVSPIEFSCVKVVP